MEKKKMKLWKKILLIISTIIVIGIIAFGAYKLYWQFDIEKRYKEFEKTQAIETKGTLSYIEDENLAKVNEDNYVFQDEIGVKIDSMSMTDDTFEVDVNFKLNKEFNYENLGFGYAIYDENKNIYEISTRMHMGENEKYDYNSIFIQRELGIEGRKDIYDTYYLADRASTGYKSINENEKIIVETARIEAKDKFPKSKKLYLKIFDLGYFETNKDEEGKMIAKNFNLSDSKWLFEFDVPEQMNERKTLNLKLDKDIPGLTITKMTLTETKLVLNFNSEDYLTLIDEGKDMNGNEFLNKCNEMLNITDGEGKVFQDIGGGTTGENAYKISFDATKKDLPNKLFLNFKVEDKEYKSELVENNNII